MDTPLESAPMPDGPISDGEDSPTLIILDTETTGLDHKTECLLEVAAVKLRGEEIVETYTSLVKPSVPIRSSSFQIHHISEEMVADAPGVEEVLPALLAFIDGLPFVAHNAVFDYSFISEAHKKLYGHRWKTRKIDTLDMYRNVFPDEPSHGLSSMLARFGFESFVSHRALDDAMNLAKVYPKLRFLYQQKYQWQFSQLGRIEYLVERYQRMQKAIQMMQGEMSDLKEIFKLHFKEGGSSIATTSGDLMVSNTRRSYEYNDQKVWSILHGAALVERGAKLNPRALDRLIQQEMVDEDVREELKEARILVNESMSVQFIKPQAPELDIPADESAPAEEGEGIA